MSRFGLGFIGAGGVPGNDSFTKILLHLDGANGGTSFPDVNSGGSAHTWSATGSASTVTSTFKFGSSALSTGQGTRYISTPAHADFAVGAGDFTVDFWWNPGGSNSTCGLCGHGVDSSFTTVAWFIVRNNTNTLSFLCSNGSSWTGPTTSTTFTGSAWVHIAAVRASGVLKLFINGVQEGGDVAGSFSIPSPSTVMAIGNAGTSTAYATSNLFSYFDEFRFSNGVARWTSNFTPPIAAYT